MACKANGDGCMDETKVEGVTRINDHEFEFHNLAGVSTNEIARRLEFLEVARPNERLNRKLHEGDDPTYNKWHPSTVLRILNSSAYIGELVSGKTRTASYKGIGLHPVEKKEWHIVENAHEAIILKSDFEKVQARREQNKEKRERAMARSKATREKCYNHLSGMVWREVMEEKIRLAVFGQ